METKPVFFGAVLLIISGLRASESTASRLSNIPPGQPFTFAVLGDNRGDDSGDQPAAFIEVLQAVRQAAPAFVLDSGDMIYGHTEDETKIRQEWRRYCEVIKTCPAPMFHVPGNHDIWDEASGGIYRELWGKTYYAFDYGNSRFIGLDTETADGHLGEEQLRWLEQQFERSTQRNVFVFLHRPLFPVDGGIGSSLDRFVAERDRVHKLFVTNRKVVRGVFAGHEHLYSFQRRDGLPYYISGGGGAPLYLAPELGGFHHFLLVRVRGDQVEVELNKVCAPMRRLEKPRLIARGELLESWTQGLFWYSWDRTTTIELTPEPARAGSRGLRVNFDLAQYAWPVLALSLAAPWDLSTRSALDLDVYVPDSAKGTFLLTPSLQGATKHEAQAARLNPGWNTIQAPLDGQWLPASERSNVTAVEWSLSAEALAGKGFVIFDNFRAVRGGGNHLVSTELLETWERPLLWRTFDETVHAEIVHSTKPVEEKGLRLHLNLSECNRPVLFALLNPPWDLTKVKALQLQVAVSDSFPDDVSLKLVFRAKDVDFASPSQKLRLGNSQMRFDLGGAWLPQKTRAAVEQVEFAVLSGSTNSAGTVLFERLSAD